MNDKNFIAVPLELVEAGKFEAARNEFRRLRLSTSDTEAVGDCLYGELLCLVAMQRVTEARPLLEEYRKAWGHVQESQARGNLIEAKLDWLEGRHDRALKLLDRTENRHRDLLQHPQLRDVYEELQYGRGMLLATAKRFREARPLLEDSLNFSNYISGDLYYELGLCYLAENDLDKAEKAFHDAIRTGLEPAWACPTYHDLGKVYMRKRAYGRAIQEFEIALKLAEQIGVSRKYIFEAMSMSYKELGLKTEADKYARLAEVEK